MTPRQIDLVQQSFAEVKPIAATAAELFYGRLFTLDPSLRPLFKGDIVRQGQMLMSMIGAAVAGLRNLDTLAPVVRQLGARHVGYGVRNEENVFNVPRRKLPEGKIEPGMTLQMRTEQGPVMATVKSLKGDYVTIDANHPLADMTLHFEVKVVDVRDATAEELEHGHIHGAGGHH
jgi:hypothetical protein